MRPIRPISEGLYAALAAIHEQLDEVGLAAIYRDRSRAACQPRPWRGGPLPGPVDDPRSRRLRGTNPPLRWTPAARWASLDDVDRAALAEVQRSDGAEVICIVRPLSNPERQERSDHARSGVLGLLEATGCRSSGARSAAPDLAEGARARRAGALVRRFALRDGSGHFRTPAIEVTSFWHIPSAPRARAALEDAMKLFCVRHGETCFNLAGRIQGQTDSQLSPLGRRQCQAVAEALAELEMRRRDRQPACAGARSRPSASPTSCSLQVRDRAAADGNQRGHLSGAHAGTRSTSEFPAEAAPWRSQDPDYRIPGGESRRDLMLRARRRRSGRFARPAIARRSSWRTADRCRRRSRRCWRFPPSVIRSRSATARSASSLWENDFKLLSLNETATCTRLTSGGGDL